MQGDLKTDLLAIIGRDHVADDLGIIGAIEDWLKTPAADAYRVDPEAAEKTSGI